MFHIRRVGLLALFALPPMCAHSEEKPFPYKVDSWIPEYFQLLAERFT